MTTPAKQLGGLELDGGWRVIEPIAVSGDHTGGHFSQGYIVESSGGDQGFLKALDFTKALQADDPARALYAMTQAFNFERDVLLKCRGADRVVRVLADGKVVVAGQTVQYLIFELANGDVRSQANVSKRFNLAFALRALHHVATGLSQLHSRDIAHQDLKPSNVLLFDGKVSKVADLGRAGYKGYVTPHEELEIAGDRTYAPLELHYHHIDPDWNRRRFGCDAYLLGSMVVFFFSGIGMTAFLFTQLHESHNWHNWGGTYEEVLPYVRDAFDRVMGSFQTDIPGEVRDVIVTTVRELCEPDPRLRGHPFNRGRAGSQYSLERYISQFDMLAKRAELGLLGL